MYHTLAFLVKRPGMTTAEFIEYYENKHIPLIEKLSGDTMPTTYTRRYTDHESAGAKKAASEGAPLDFDVITELVFPDEAGFNRWLQTIFAPGSAEQVHADEEKFLDRPKTRSATFQYHVTS